MKKKIIKLLLITTLSTLILTGCKDSEDTISNAVETTENASVIESSNVAENTFDTTSEITATPETSETESDSDSASAIETSESETDSTTETTTEPVSASTTESNEEDTAEENSSDDSTEVATTQGTVTVISSDFIAILNVKRAEAGLPLVSTSANLDALTTAHVVTLQNDFSHSNPNLSREHTCNISMGYGDSNAQRIFDGWWNSEGHKAAMMHPYITSVSVAYYSDGGYFIFYGDIDEEAYLNSLDTPSTAPVTDPVNSTDVGNGQTVEVEGTPGAVEVVPPDEAQDLKDQWGW